MPTRQQIIHALAAELTRPGLSEQRRAQLQGALDHQLALPPEDGRQYASQDEHPAIARSHRENRDRATMDAPTSAGGTYNAQHCLAAQMDKLPIAPMATTDQHRIENLKERRLIALEYVKAFKIRAECATTREAQAEDLKCQHEWADYARELAAQITTTRARVRQAAHRSR